MTVIQLLWYRRNRLLVVLGVGLVVWPTPDAFAAFIEIGPLFESDAYAWDGSFREPDSLTTYDPRSGTVVVDLEENPGNRNHTEWRANASEVSIHWAHDSLAPSPGLGGSGSRLSVRFRVDELTPYRVDGLFELGTAGLNQMYVDIRLLGAGNLPLFSNRITNWGSAPPPFSASLTAPIPPIDGFAPIRGPEGDVFSPLTQLTGSPEGVLVPGQNYNFQVWVDHNLILGLESGSTSGFVRLRAVPEPSTALLLVLGLAGLSRKEIRGAQAKSSLRGEGSR